MNRSLGDEEKIDELNEKISEIEAFENREKVMKNFNNFSDNPVMLIGKDTKNVLSSDLVVDSWTVSYKDNLKTGDYELVEKYEGPVNIEQTDKQKYLGFIISNIGDNMVNITSLKQKSIGIIKQIFKRLESLNLRRYYFE